MPAELAGIDWLRGNRTAPVPAPGTCPRVSAIQVPLTTAAALGAIFLNVMADDPDLHRARDTFAALVQAARLYGCTRR